MVAIGDAMTAVMTLYPRIYFACHTRHVRDPQSQRLLSRHQASILDHLDEIEPTTVMDLAAPHGRHRRDDVARDRSPGAQGLRRPPEGREGSAPRARAADDRGRARARGELGARPGARRGAGGAVERRANARGRSKDWAAGGRGERDHRRERPERTIR